MASYMGSIVIPRKLSARHKPQTIPCSWPLIHLTMAQT